MADELQKIGHGTSRAVITGATPPEREPIFNKGATGKELFITVDAVDYYISTVERLGTGATVPINDETLTAGAKLIGVDGTFASLTTGVDLLTILEEIDGFLSSPADAILKNGTINMEGFWRIEGQGLDIYPVQTADVDETYGKKIKLGMTTGVFDSENLSAELNATTNFVTPSNWDVTNGFSVASNKASYAHDALGGSVTCNVPTSAFEPFKYYKVEIEIRSVVIATGSAQLIIGDVTIDLSNTTDMTFTLFALEGQVISATSTDAGTSFDIELYSVKECANGLFSELDTGLMQIINNLDSSGEGGSYVNEVVFDLPSCDTSFLFSGDGEILRLGPSQGLFNFYLDTIIANPSATTGSLQTAVIAILDVLTTMHITDNS